MAGASQPLSGFAKCRYTLGSLTFIDALLCLCALFATSTSRSAAFSYLHHILIARTQHKYDTNSHDTWRRFPSRFPQERGLPWLPCPGGGLQAGGINSSTVTWIHTITCTGTEKKVCVRTNPKFHATTNTFILTYDTYVFRLVFLTYI